MNLKELSGIKPTEAGARVADSSRSDLAKKRLRDSAKRKIKDELEATETTEQAIEVAVNALEDQEPEVVIEAVIETLGGIIEELS